jgi:hypothetical protein
LRLAGKARVLKAQRQIAKLDLAEVLYFLCDYDGGPRYLRSHINHAVELYQKFLTLRLLHWHQKAIPSKPVDLIWHNHILMTEKYIADCQSIFGRYLHHDPMYRSRSWEELQQYGFDRHWTLDAMNTYFGISGDEYTNSKL